MKQWRITSSDTGAGLSKWADGLSEAFVRLEPVATISDGFFGSISQVNVGDLDVSLVSSNGHEVRRLREHIRTRNSETLFVNLLSRGRSLVEQGASYDVAPMDVCVVDTGQPFRIRHEAAFQLASIAVPTAMLGSDIRGQFHLSRSASGRELSNVIWSLAKSLLATDRSKTALAHVLADQLSRSLALLPEFSATQGRCDRVEMLRAYILRHLDQPDLRAATVARHFGLSVRRVHQLFEPGGQTVSEFINDERLQRAADLLCCGTLPDLPISEIAWRVGYSDPSYFNRRFRRRFGMAPRTYREASRGGCVAQ